MSSSSGTAPAISIAATVATAVWDTVATVAPSPMPKPRRISASASVPLAQPPARAAPSHAANPRSNASHSRQGAYQPPSLAPGGAEPRGELPPDRLAFRAEEVPAAVQRAGDGRVYLLPLRAVARAR